MTLGCLFDIGGERSWTDLLTNETYIHPLDALVEPASIIGGHIPSAGIPALLHEAVHHCCLQGPVGLALAALEFRARRLATSDDPSERADATNLALAVRSVLEIYRPLLEGLALFAEFDAVPGDSKVVSPPLLITATLTLRGHTEDIWPKLFGVVSDARQTRESLDRRKTVLATSFDNPEGYLLGYAYTKTWQRWAASTTPLLHDTGYALLFLSDYFFADYDLVDLLLTDNLKPDTISEILRHCGARLGSLGTKQDWTAETTAHESARYGHRPDLTELTERASLSSSGLLEIEPPMVPALHGERGHQRLNHAIANTPIEDRRALARRSMLHLASLPVDLHVEDHGVVALFRNFPVLVVPPDESYAGEGGPATLDLIVDSTTTTHFVVLAAHDNEIAYLSAIGPHSEYGELWIRQFSTSRSADNLPPFEDLVRNLDASFETRIAALRKAIRDLSVALYSPLALAWAPRATHQTLLKQPHGIAGLLGSELTFAYAVLGVVDNAGGYMTEVTMLDEAADLDLPAAVAAIDECFTAIGVKGIRATAQPDGATRVETVL